MMSIAVKKLNHNHFMKKNNKLGAGIAIGIGIGTAVGVVTNNLGLWLGVGIAIGAGIGTILTKKNKTKENDKS